jgi:alanine racemase
VIDLVDLLQTTGGALHGPAFDRRFSSFLYDSRLLSASATAPGAKTTPGPLFVAVKSETGDGHDYILDAVARGACGVLCQRPVDLADHGVTCIVVPDTRAALLAYAAFALQRPNLTTVGITGSVGKTTTKELITAVLARGRRPVFHNQGSINGRYGLSIAAGELTAQHEIAVLELAADSFDEIRDLAALTRPQVGVVTSVGEAHLATFASLAAIAEEKGRLLEALPPDGLAVLNADDSHVLAMADRTRAQVLTVGVHPAADLRIDSLLAHEAGLLCTFSDNRAWLAQRLNEEALSPARLTLRSRLLGRHHAPLLLAALAVGAWFGQPLEEMLAVLASFAPLPGHLAPLAGRHGALLLDDTANASPASMAAALETLALFPGRLRAAVLGDMWDLGAYEAEAHRQAGRQAAAVADWLLVKGQRAQEIATGAQDAGMPRQRIFRAYTDADIVRFVEELVDGTPLRQVAGRLGNGRLGNGRLGNGRLRNGTPLRQVDEESGQASDPSAAAPHPPATPSPHHPVTLSPGHPVILFKADRPARMERIVAALLAEPERAGELLERQSAGWLQVRPLTQDRPTWTEIDLEALAGNVRRTQQIVGPEVAICAVLKADGYGHGAASVARTALNNGAQMLAVACLAEAVTLRRAAIDAPILALGYTPAWQARDTVRQDVIATVYDLDVARALSRAAADLNRSARVHVKVDTGMARLGLLPDEVAPFMAELMALPGLAVEGIFTHFSVADSAAPEHRAHTRAQLAAFHRVLAELAAMGVAIPLVHAANSAAMLNWPESRFAMVRPGIALYGLAPSPDAPLPAGFRPVLSWKTQVAQVKTLPAGAPVSYGNTFVTQRATKVAVAPVGYADGFRRGPAHWGHVLVRGQAAPIIGRVTMDQTLLDVTDIPDVRQGDEVTLIGRQGASEITVEQVAERLGTISYEVVAEILARVPRVV